VKEKELTYDVGVLVARFQVHELHDAHKELIDFVRERHHKVLVVLGASEVRGTTNNPLDIHARKQLVLRDYPDVETAYIHDEEFDEPWSKKLDKIIADNCTPHQTVMLYGGRDSFVDHYKGKHPTTVLESDRVFSGTLLREEVGGRGAQADPQWRAGAIWQAFNRYPTAFPTVDVAIFNDDYTKLLLVRKPNEEQWRLPGGFVDPRKDPHLEAAARRESHEETGLDITDPEYITSRLVDDWRYRREQDKIMTALFGAKRLSGHVNPADDVAEAQWFETSTLSATRQDQMPVVEHHRPLVVEAIKYASSKIGD
jgi:bifunctional NMN adenylyltransferase/nudix hydrolase